MVRWLLNATPPLNTTSAKLLKDDLIHPMGMLPPILLN